MLHCGLWRQRKWLWAKARRWPLEAGKGMDIDYHLESTERRQPCQHLNYKTSAQKDYKIINLWYFKLLKLQQTQGIHIGIYSETWVRESCWVVGLALASFGMNCCAQQCCLSPTRWGRLNVQKLKVRAWADQTLSGLEHWEREADKIFFKLCL